MSNGRKSSRRRVLKGALAAFNGRHSAIPCTVRDFSDTGCRLACEAWTSVPDRFELVIDLDGLIVECAVAWRRNGEIGVKFAAPPERREPRRTQVLDAVVPPKKASLRRRSGAEE